MGSPPLGRDFRAVPPPAAATRGGVRMTRLRKLSRRIVLADHRSKLTVYFQSLHNSDIYRKFQGVRAMGAGYSINICAAPGEIGELACPRTVVLREPLVPDSPGRVPILLKARNHHFCADGDILWLRQAAVARLHQAVKDSRGLAQNDRGAPVGTRSSDSAAYRRGPARPRSYVGSPGTFDLVRASSRDRYCGRQIAGAWARR
jgi:hypothetical protein